jgi:hypothetical protein
VPRSNTQNTKRPELHYHIVLGHSNREVRFERAVGYFVDLLYLSSRE